MRTIPLSPVPNQSFSLRLDNTRLVLRLKEANGVMVADVQRDGETILSATRVLAGEAIIPYGYLEEGNFILQTIDDELPDWRQFGASQVLVYLTAPEVAVLRLGGGVGTERMTFGVPPFRFGANTAAGRVLGDAPSGYAIDFRANSALRRNANNRVADNAIGTARAFTSTQRAGTAATYYSADRVLLVAAPNELRLDHDPRTGASLGALIEAEATNMQLWSSDLSQAFYSKNGVSIGTADGTPTRIIENNANAAHLISNGGVNVVGGTRYCVSGEFKSNGRPRFVFAGNGNNFPASVNVDLEARTITSVNGSPSDLRLVDIGDGYFLVGFSAVSPSSGAAGMVIALREVFTAASYQGNGASGLIVRRLQFEAGATPSSRIATTTAPVTRPADQVSFTLPAGVHRLTYTFDDGTSFGPTVRSGAVTIPTNLPRRHVANLVALPQ